MVPCEYDEGILKMSNTQCKFDGADLVEDTRRFKRQFSLQEARMNRVNDPCSRYGCTLKKGKSND
jgi:hypothetical protein